MPRWNDGHRLDGDLKEVEQQPRKEKRMVEVVNSHRLDKRIVIDGVQRRHRSNQPEEVRRSQNTRTTSKERFTREGAS